MPAQLHQFTVEALEAFPQDVNRYELFHGVLLVTPQAGLPHQIARWDAVKEHYLAVEVSRTDSRICDRDYKRDGYLGIGVREVWFVDLDLQRVFVSRIEGEQDISCDTTLTWRSPGGSELHIDVPTVFRSIPRHK